MYIRSTPRGAAFSRCTENHVGGCDHCSWVYFRCGCAEKMKLGNVGFEPQSHDCKYETSYLATVTGLWVRSMVLWQTHVSSMNPARMSFIIFARALISKCAPHWWTLRCFASPGRAELVTTQKHRIAQRLILYPQNSIQNGLIPFKSPSEHSVSSDRCDFWTTLVLLRRNLSGMLPHVLWTVRKSI